VSQASSLHSHIQTAYPQALAKLLYALNNIEDAEDYLQSAVEKTLINWQKEIPDNPVAWLVQVARNQYIDFYRHHKKQSSRDFTEEQGFDEQTTDVDLSEEALLLSYNDDLLRLIFTCCHPALNQQTQIILALKHVLGLSVNNISSALLIPIKTLQQRLLRAKKKITLNNIQYEVPKLSSWQQRLDGVLKTIYLLFNAGYLTVEDEKPIRTDLCKEAIRLTRLLHRGVRDHSEILGLLALLLHQDARRPARFDENGDIILLDQQDRTLWKQTNIQEANSLVHKSLRIGGATSYALQAAIAALHNHLGDPKETDWQQIYGLYLKLIEIDDNAVIRLNSLVALAKAGEIDRAIDKMFELEQQLENYPYYYSAIAGLFFESKRFDKAKTFYKRALMKADSDYQLRFLTGKIKECEG
jgi:RNA polymerase sigma-70 factor (ECF subfamily)